MNQKAEPISVKRTVSVDAPAEQAFRVFGNMGCWWIKTHSLVASEQKDVIVEPHKGGRWYEIGVEGEEQDWGCVQTYDPPNRLVLVWRLNTEWKYDPDLETIVEVKFIAENSTSTRVELEHRQLEAYGQSAELMAFKLGSPDAWSGLLSAFTELTDMD
ncbi:MAG: ATPase [Gammaproteobacteria bacterium]|nr:ATPase [Gammaproteobacteria bacterium]